MPIKLATVLLGGKEYNVPCGTEHNFFSAVQQGAHPEDVVKQLTERIAKECKQGAP